MLSRRAFLASTSVALAAPAQGPNVVVILTDDQGYGDFSFHGNPHLKTPNLDRLARESVRFRRFYSHPVCAPTRAGLMTGRYYYRTGVTDTFLGRAMMHADETTMPELLRQAGYRTGIFGKWHLGDNYPLRAMDQGFEEALVHLGGGIGQPSDPPGGEHYQDPILFHNGKQQPYKGYCTDVFTDAALRFIEQNRSKPFFAYLATNAPHTPLEVPDRYVAPYRSAGLPENTARVYGMVANLDENIGRLLKKLDEWKLAENTILVFSTDNGPQEPRFNAGLRGRKGEVYEGGVKVPCWVRYPKLKRAGAEVEAIATHYDLLPTLLAACGVAVPQTIRFDGINLWPQIRSESTTLPDRALFLQWHRGEVPQAHRNAAVVTQRYKLVNGKELYDIPADPNETRDLAADHPDVVQRLRSQYDRWFADVSATRQFAPPRIYLGAPQENPVTLTRQDWRGPRASWDANGCGFWEVDVRRPGPYAITCRFPPADASRSLQFQLGAVQRSLTITAGARQATLHDLQLPTGPQRLEAYFAGAQPIGVHYVDLSL